MVAVSGSRLATPSRRHGCAPEPYAFWRRNRRCGSLESISGIKPPGSLRSTAVITTKKLPQRPQICPLKDFKSCKTPVRGLSRPGNGEKSPDKLQKCWAYALCLQFCLTIARRRPPSVRVALDSPLWDRRAASTGASQGCGGRQRRKNGQSRGKAGAVGIVSDGGL